MAANPSSCFCLLLLLKNIRDSNPASAKGCEQSPSQRYVRYDGAGGARAPRFAPETRATRCSRLSSNRTQTLKSSTHPTQHHKFKLPFRQSTFDLDKNNPKKRSRFYGISVQIVNTTRPEVLPNLGTTTVSVYAVNISLYFGNPMFQSFKLFGNYYSLRLCCKSFLVFWELAICFASENFSGTLMILHCPKGNLNFNADVWCHQRLAAGEEFVCPRVRRGHTREFAFVICFLNVLQL